MIPMIRGTSPALADFSFEKLDLGEIVCDRILREIFNPFFSVFSHQESAV